MQNQLLKDDIEMVFDSSLDRTDLVETTVFETTVLETKEHEANSTVAIATVIAASALLQACGGGGGSSSSTTITNPIPTVLPTMPEAARFLIQASIGSTSTETARVQTIGYANWLDEQFAIASATNLVTRLNQKGFADIAFKNQQDGFDEVIWQRLITAPDSLRVRIALALSEILVVGIDGLMGLSWQQFSAAAYYDLLAANCFGNYRTILQQISTNPAMGTYLTFRGNEKLNVITGAEPDENYARELLQLFTIGLVELNIDGTPKLYSGQPKETYTQDDVSGLARIFTGWEVNINYAGGAFNSDNPGYVTTPMIQIASRHETGASSFLANTVPAGLNGVDSLTRALDIIFAHPNIAPFISRQLIQKLVTSNPAPAYVARVATVFNNDGTGVKGNMQAVVKAILLDAEATQASNLINPQFGKVREPMLRFLSWARAFNAKSASDAWAIGNTSETINKLGQSPLRSPSVFNFFRPGYVPPNSDVASANLVAPELQLANETSVIGYVNFMQKVVSNNGEIGDVFADYTNLLTIADNAINLLDALNLLLAANQLSSATLTNLSSAVATMPAGNDAARKNRIYAALTLVFAAPEFLVSK